MSVISLEEQRKKLGKHLDSDVPSPPNTPSGELGLIPTDQSELGLMCVYDVCRRAWLDGISVKGRFARSSALWVAMAATEGLISTKVDDERWASAWMITDGGIEFMMELENAYN